MVPHTWPELHRNPVRGRKLVVGFNGVFRRREAITGVQTWRGWACYLPRSSRCCSGDRNSPGSEEACTERPRQQLPWTVDARKKKQTTGDGGLMRKTTGAGGLELVRRERKTHRDRMVHAKKKEEKRWISQLVFFFFFCTKKKTILT